MLGSYAALNIDAGLHKAGTVQVLTKGSVSLALAGTGRGFDLGVSVTDVKLKRAIAAASADI
jgi:hypothetical protein